MARKIVSRREQSLRDRIAKQYEALTALGNEEKALHREKRAYENAVMRAIMSFDRDFDRLYLKEDKITDRLDRMEQELSEMLEEQTSAR